MDHDRVNISSSVMSCGVMQLSRICEEIDEALFAIASRLYHPSRGEPCAFFVWSNLTKDDRLRLAVEEIGFGTTTVSSPAENPRTGNIIYVHLWNINHVTFKAWYAHQRKKKICQVGT